KVSWPENETRGAWLADLSLRVFVSLILYPQWQFQLAAVELRQKPLDGEPDDGGFADVALFRGRVQPAVQGFVQINRDRDACPFGFRAGRGTLSRLSHGFVQYK